MCSGAYIIPCRNCSSSYFGETVRSFETSLDEHKKAVRNRYLNYATFKHVAATGHDLDWGESRLFFKSNDWYIRLVVESSCINTCQNFNNMRSTLGIDNFSANIIFNSHPEVKLDI